MKHLFVVSMVTVCVVATVPMRGQQRMSVDEKQIRDLIAAWDKGTTLPTTKDQVFWSGAYKRPTVGDEKPEENPGELKPSNRVPGSQRVVTNVRRIEIAKSGDLAYEFSNSDLSFTVQGGGRVLFPTSSLRAWRKEAGQWKVAADFMRSHDE